MPIRKLTRDEAREFAALPANRKNDFLGRQLSRLIVDGEAKLNIVAALDTGLRDYIIRAHNEVYGDRLLMGGAYTSAGLALGFAGGTLVAGNSWWGAILVGLLIFFLLGFFISRYTTKLAVTKLVAMSYAHFEVLWEAKVLSVRFSDASEMLDSRRSHEWHGAVQTVLGLSDPR